MRSSAPGRTASTDCHDGVRLHHHRIGLGRFRHGAPPVGGRPPHACSCSNMAAPTSGPLIQMPSALSYPMNMSTYDWGFVAEPEPALGGRRLVTPRGKVIGGSSSINGMVYVRGHATRLRHLGGDGRPAAGAFATCCPISSAWNHRMAARKAGAARDGPLHVTRGTPHQPALSTPSSKPAARRAIRSPTTTTAASRKASAPWS